MGFSLSCLQRAVLSFIPGQDVLAAAAVLPQLSDLLPQCGVFSLQEGGAYRDLVLFQPPCVAGSLRCQIVLLSPGPVFVILLLIRNKHLFGLLDHRLRLQLLVRELVLARVEQLSPRHAGQDQVCGIRLEINVHLDGFWVNGGGCVTFCSGGGIYEYRGSSELGFF